ncbi:hypothetical protein HMPREF1569_3771 [Klebsiella oxytoca OK-1]|nr:hypothetical protein HMPREF1569_3771 [Klebsiella oxytoca OK-1]
MDLIYLRFHWRGLINNCPLPNVTTTLKETASFEAVNN